MYTVCTEHGSKEFTNMPEAQAFFGKLEAKNTEACLYEGDKLIKKTDFTNNML